MVDLKVRPSYVYQQYRDQQWVKDFFSMLDEYKQKQYYDSVKSFITARDIIHANSAYLTFYTYHLLGLYRPLGSTAVTNYFDIGYIYDAGMDAKNKEELFKKANDIASKYKKDKANFFKFGEATDNAFGWWNNSKSWTSNLTSRKRDALDTPLTDDELEPIMGAYFEPFDKFRKKYGWQNPITPNQMVEDIKDLEKDYQKAKEAFESKYPLMSFKAYYRRNSIFRDLGDFNYQSFEVEGPLDPELVHTQVLAITLLNDDNIKWHYKDVRNPPPYDNTISQEYTNASPFDNVKDMNFIYDDSAVYDGTISQEKFLLYLSYIYNYDYEISNLDYIVSFIAKWCEIDISEIKITSTMDSINLVLPSTDATTEFVRLTVNYGDVLGFPKGPFLDIRIEKPSGDTI